MSLMGRGPAPCIHATWAAQLGIALGTAGSCSGHQKAMCRREPLCGRALWGGELAPGAGATPTRKERGQEERGPFSAGEAGMCVSQSPWRLSTERRAIQELVCFPPTPPGCTEVRCGTTCGSMSGATRPRVNSPEPHVQTVWLGRAAHVPAGRRAAFARPAEVPVVGSAQAPDPRRASKHQSWDCLFWNFWGKSFLFLKALPTIKPCLKGALPAKASPRWAADTRNCKIPAQHQMRESFMSPAARGLTGGFWEEGH